MYEYFVIKDIVTGCYYSNSGNWINPTSYIDDSANNLNSDIMLYMDKNSAENQVNLLGVGFYVIEKLYMVNY
jgi:hypothetical protein